MLEIRLSCEHCDKSLPNESSEAMICTYECTFCQSCVEDVLKNVCPNCGGGFEKRPIRPKDELLKNPPRRDKVYKPIVLNKYLDEMEDIPPNQR